jgi:hypothetical protein
MASVTQLPGEPKAPSVHALGMHRRLDLDETLTTLLADGLLTEADAKRVRLDIRTARGRSELHPLVLVANLKLADLRHPDKPLSLEVLTQWLADKAALPYLKIDPMKIDVASVTQVVSSMKCRSSSPLNMGRPWPGSKTKGTPASCNWCACVSIASRPSGEMMATAMSVRAGTGLSWAMDMAPGWNAVIWLLSRSVMIMACAV